MMKRPCSDPLFAKWPILGQNPGSVLAVSHKEMNVQKGMNHFLFCWGTREKREYFDIIFSLSSLAPSFL